jgi:uncharacterized protein
MIIVYVYIFLTLIFFGVPLIVNLINLYPEYLWFLDLGYQEVFIKFLVSKWALFFSFTFISFMFIYLNIIIALNVRKKLLNEPEIISNNPNKFDFFETISNLISFKINTKIFSWLPFIGSIIISVLAGLPWLHNWETFLLFLNKVNFNNFDPIFIKDISFYVFSYPFLSLLKNWTISIIIITAILVSLIYAHYKSFSFKKWTISLYPKIRIHLSLILSLIFLGLAWTYRFAMYELLISKSGAFTGAGYTEIYANLLGLRILIGISLFISFLFLVNIIKQVTILIIFTATGLLLTSIIMLGVYPSLLSQFIVNPNEIEKERPFIQYNIDYTRKAYNLDKIIERDITIPEKITKKDILDNQDTLDNVRLWDTSPLLQTLSQLQEIRLYYDFNDVDIDRYWIDNKYQQVMIAARELDVDKLPIRAQNWINNHLTYTHGYGLVMMPVNKVTKEGLPEFYIYDIPSKTNIDFNINNLSIYFGESTNKYIITNTSAKEFHYSADESTQYTIYNGNKGIYLDSFFKKLIFSIKFNEFKILFSDYILTESKIHFDRNIITRAKKITPFLVYDSDPYPVIVSGDLYWYMDAYTMGKNYPYSEPFYLDYNYIRNSVKVIINAYTGQINFYIVDKNDPIIKTYNKTYPNLFKSIDELEESFQLHFRYPLDLFSVQSKIYSSYHMTDPQTFYNQEDLWVIPKKISQRDTGTIEPYYINMKLPEDENLTFRLMIPFSPAKKNNMIGWMSANCDYPNYGNITVYKLPKDQLIYGPIQIESRIEQDTEISQLLTLWGQMGTSVIRKNLLIIPINNSFIYVQPIYLQADTSKFPELKRVIVSYKNNLVMEETFEEALQKALLSEISFSHQNGKHEESTSIVNSFSNYTINEQTQNLIQKAKELYDKAQESLKSAKWKEYGDNINTLGEILVELERVINYE